MDNLSQHASQITFDVSKAFSDFIFKDDTDATDELNSSENSLYANITQDLEGSSELANLVPVLPERLVAFLDEVGQENTDFDKICRIVESDISLAGETIRIANSPLYRRSLTPIETISKAIAMLGLDGVNRIATSLMMKQVLTIECDDLKQIGEFLWSHCLECAEASRYLNTDEDQFASYLLGLVHDVGAVAIFSCYANHHNDIEPGSANHSKVLKLIMEEQANWLSAHIAKEWNLPESVVSALYDFDSMKQMEMLDCDISAKSDLALVLDKANTCSEVYTLVKEEVIEEEAGRSILLDSGLSDKEIDEVFAKFDVMHRAKV